MEEPKDKTAPSVDPMVMGASRSSAGALPDEVGCHRQLLPGEEYKFSCHPDLACFTHCCADVNIMLTPVDVLNLSRHLGITSSEFLDQYALLPITKDLQLPVVMLKMQDDEGKRCHFVSDEKGCTVYEHRPWACRMYPLGMALPPAKAGVQPQPTFFVIEDDFCDGHKQEQAWTVQSWRANQGLERHEELEQGFAKIVSHPWFIGGRRLNPPQMEMFFTACYDLDKFRQFVLKSSFLQRFEVEEQVVEEIKKDDVALLHFAYRWLRFALFGETTLAVREGVEEEARKRMQQKQ